MDGQIWNPPKMKNNCNLFPPLPLHALVTNVVLFQFQETPLPPAASRLTGSLRGEARGGGEAGPGAGAGGRRRPGPSACGLMGSSPLSLGETSLVSSPAAGRWPLPVRRELLSRGWRQAHLDSVTALPPLPRRQPEGSVPAGDAALGEAHLRHLPGAY